MAQPKNRNKIKQRDITTHLPEWPKSGITTTPSAGEDVERQKFSSLLGVGGCMQNGAAAWEDSLVVSYETKYIGNSNLASGYLLKGTETCFYT